MQKTMNSTGTSRTPLIAAVLLFAGTACMGTLPPQIHQQDVELSFGGLGSGRAEQDQLSTAAELCRSNLNGHISAANASSIVRSVLTASGGLTAGVGGVTAAVLSEPDQQRTSAWVSAIGGGVALIAPIIIGLTDDPSTRLTRHSRGLRSWEEAVREADLARTTSDSIEGRVVLIMSETTWRGDTIGIGENCTIVRAEGSWFDGPAQSTRHACQELVMTGTSTNAIVTMGDGHHVTGTNPDETPADNRGICSIVVSCTIASRPHSTALAAVRDNLRRCHADLEPVPAASQPSARRVSAPRPTVLSAPQ